MPKTILISFLVAFITSIITFKVNEYLQDSTLVENVQKRLNEIVGKNGKIVYNRRIYNFDNVDNFGIKISNKLQTIYIPSSELISLPIILPRENYKEVLDKEEIETINRFSNHLPKMMNKLYKNLKDELDSGNTIEANIKISKKFYEELKEKGSIQDIK